MKRTKKITYAAMFTALSVAVLLLASLFQVADLAVSLFASLLLVLALIELGQSFAFMIYAASGILALLLLPQKFTALLYLAFSGLYPLLKRFFDARGKVLSWVLKLLYLNTALTAAVLASKFIFAIPFYPPLLMVCFYLLANLTFILFDYCLKRLTFVYLVRYREKTKRFFK